jgi:DNA-directed RNA polymerase subunit L
MFQDYTESGPPLFAQKGKIRASFRLSGHNVTIANTIRRILLTHTPSVGFRTEPFEKTDVDIQINTTPLVNEMLAHRIGMIPICADPLAFDPSIYEFHIDMKNDTKELMDVCAKDFKIFKRTNPLDAPEEVDSSIFFPADPITGDTVLITRLRPQWSSKHPNEHLKVKARASISTGKENIRWSPVCQASYKYTLNPDPEAIQRIFVNWLHLNKKILDISTLTEQKQGELKREFDTMEIQRCYLKNAKEEANDFSFEIESVGVQSIPEIMLTALRVSEAMVAKYKGEMPPNVAIQVGDSRFSSIDVIFQNENHTLGNLLETYLVEHHVDGSAEPRINYAGYKVPHPLRPEMFVRIDTRTPEEVLHNTVVPTDELMLRAKRAISSVCTILEGIFQSLQADWIDLTNRKNVAPQ